MKNIISTIISIATCTFLAQFSNCYAMGMCSMPAGSYTATCSGCSVQAVVPSTMPVSAGTLCQLTCNCQSPNGILPASINFVQPGTCPIFVENINGVLRMSCVKTSVPMK
jgi:hypothetical protein